MIILDYNEYTSENPFMKVNEGHGISNTLKDLFKISIDKVIKSISDNSLISIDFELLILFLISLLSIHSRFNFIKLFNSSTVSNILKQLLEYLLYKSI